MGLRVEHISYRDFRNYEHLELSDIGSLTVFVGPNAVGKTNIVEGIQLLTAQTSFKHPTSVQLIREGCDHAKLAADLIDGDRMLLFGLDLAEGKRKFSLNGKAKRAVDLKGVAPSVVFAPDDLQLAKGSMSRRRDAIDSVGSQISRNHYEIRRDWDKILRQKNALLKDGADPVLVESVNDVVVTCGAQLTCYRFALFLKLSRLMREYYAEISGSTECFGARYVPSWVEAGQPFPEEGLLDRETARSSLRSALEGKLHEEIRRKRACVGPQADRVEFFIDGRPVSVFASQGQQRSVVLAFKLAEVTLVKEMLGLQPILLLDDVMSELDEHRRRALVRFVSDDMQAFITTANLAYFDDDLIDRAHVVNLPIDHAPTNGGRGNG